MTRVLVMAARLIVAAATDGETVDPAREAMVRAMASTSARPETIPVA
ncbi:MAG: hypothetical protein PHQ34_10410 [Methanothrix sp.]|nr:hypothetical protein [Methanothrix sp.]